MRAPGAPGRAFVPVRFDDGCLMLLPPADWRPDLPDYPGKGSANIRNVMPRTAGSYGPFLGPNVYSNALSQRCQGAAAFIDKAGNVNLFAGDASDLYQLTSGSANWSKVSKSASPYSAPADGEWNYTYFNGDVIATDFVDTPQYFTLGVSSAFADLPGTPPQGRYIATLKNAFVMLANTQDGTNGALPQRCWWSAAGNAKTGGWPTPGGVTAATLQSGAADLLGDAGWIMGLAADLTNADGAVFLERAVKRIVYAGPPAVFDFLPAENTRGCPAPNSLVTWGGMAFYLGQDGFCGFDGAMALPIGLDWVDKFFWSDVDLNNLARVVGTVDPVNRLIWWAYPGAGSQGGNPNRLLLYHPLLQKWTVCDITCETVCRMLSIGYTLDQ